MVVVPLKGGARAKSRLSADPALALAFARDCLDAVRTCELVSRSVVVTADPATAAWAAADWRRRGRRAGAGSRAERRGPGRAAGVEGPVAALLGDLPALRPQDLALALDAARAVLRGGAAQAFVPDAAGTGTVLLAVTDGGSARSGVRRRIRRGARAARCAPVGAGPAPAAPGRGRRRGPRRAEQLGCGPHTRRAGGGARPARGRRLSRIAALRRRMVSRVQATVHRYDAASGSGSLLTDDGVVLPFSADAFAGSGLRHLRVGQRLSVQLDAADAADVAGAGPPPRATGCRAAGDRDPAGPVSTSARRSCRLSRARSSRRARPASPGSARSRG